MYTYVHLIFTRGGSRISGWKLQIHARDSLSTFYPIFHKVPYKISRSSCSLKSICKSEVYEGIHEGIHFKILIYVHANRTSHHFSKGGKLSEGEHVLHSILVTYVCNNLNHVLMLSGNS